MKYYGKYLYIAGAIVILMSILALPARARNNVHFGVRTGVYTDPNDLFFGGELITPLSRSVFFNPNLEYVLIDHGTYTTFNFDFHYDFPTRSSTMIWAGAGPALVYTNPEGPEDGNTNLGVNLLFGLGFKTSGSLIPYVQVKGIMADNSDFVLGFGIRF